MSRDDEKGVAVYVTKYALTEGILLCRDATVTWDGYAHGVTEDGPFFHSSAHWCRTETEAQDRAEKMRKAKCASLKKQLDKLGKSGPFKIKEVA